MNVELQAYKKFLTACHLTDEQAEDVINRWHEPWRFYHNENHLLDFLRKIRKMEDIPLETKDEYVLAALFHDVIYVPWRFDNEEASNNLMKQYCCKLDKTTLERVESLIMCTAERVMPEDSYLQTFWKIDNGILLEPRIDKLMEYEHLIRKEFQFVDYSIYREKRMEFLQTWVKANLNNLTPDIVKTLDMLGAYVRDYKPKIGVYAGSFNPFHIGHLNILEKAEELFDKVILAIGHNPAKPVSDHDKRIRQVKSAVMYRQIDSFSGLLTDYLEGKQEVGDTYLVRGLRNGSDLDYEENQLWCMEEIAGEKIKTVCFLCDDGFEKISSSVIRTVAALEDEKAKAFVKKNVPFNEVPD